ncbi:protein SIEVE ELEMENT OCCLUSION B-like [Prosopis cineraria]|uniref:protein SIEVE ELEMENT OCCLUSION B-like n=1 Tax=Prosopis cineraria TaxID=364024 RepID=UPI00240F586A|nr:protein SIEVE ELEMENT OCCLUSION B-like [Prosopis cineraria]
MAWYVLQDLFEIKGQKLIETEWHCMGKPMVIVVNPRGEVIHMNALYMISTWKIEAFPFEIEKEDKLFQNWKWFWNPITTASKQLVDGNNSYIIIYGGTDAIMIQKFDSLINDIKKASIVVKDFNPQKAGENEISKFWKSISLLFVSRVQKENYDNDSYYTVMIDALAKFKEWKVSGQKHEFADYYKTNKVESAVSPCYEIELSNVNSRIPISMACSELSCHLNMVIDVVKYKCCHTTSHDHHDQANVHHA